MLVPGIDVIIAAWNRSDTIERAVSSALNDVAVRSVIVVDDASNDDTASRAECMAQADARIQVLRMERNGGPSVARNRALDVARAEWVAILDGDDYVRAGRFDRLLEQADDWDIVADDLYQIDEGAEVRSARPLLGVDSTWPEKITLPAFVDANIGRPGRPRREMGFLKPILRRAFLDQYDLRYDEAARLGEDYLLYTRALAMGARFRLIPAAGYIAVMRPGSLSGRHGRKDLENLLAGDEALAALPGLTAVDRRVLRRHKAHIACKVQWLIVIEAVKARDWRRFLRAFLVSPAASACVAGNLLGEFWRRILN